MCHYPLFSPYITNIDCSESNLQLFCTNIKPKSPSKPIESHKNHHQLTILLANPHQLSIPKFTSVFLIDFYLFYLYQGVFYISKDLISMDEWYYWWKNERGLCDQKFHYLRMLPGNWSLFGEMNFSVWVITFIGIFT